ncbi:MULTISPECIES: hypothetical protein [unclassified Curtobacterium]|uniref:hypothetical protein n=1 Tax=unclassified Curtobacterium TaxID=257496 RepID=UPI000DA8EF66|nr:MULTISPECIES: hypothetical protein [unclassified Curtobacterium]PZE27163.1 hypothetical protein DEI86_06545 [Curtobacterium sp. MCBD17_028]PZE74739.1 hypothetical protein DEI82_09955 [Curtobacterium sp. MCBD17_019]PZF60321.1 hypothetical protein DEI92_08170 [Curtobacterium sp. MCBD17_034]PZF62781.1 hypothetical protein DEI81_09670 [Curtobacterium sp. MCBD17_013]PZM35006.1 hypothetical protein DEI90_06155 [Curtobacterium sp. MCBD17_031]
MYMIAGIIAVALVCFLVLIVAWLTVGSIPGTGIWPTVEAFPLIGFPIGLLLIIALLAVNWTKRARENRDDAR